MEGSHWIPGAVVTLLICSLTREKRRPIMRKRKRSLRSPALYRVVARMLFRGWTCTKIGRKLGRSRRAIRYLITCPEFAAVYRTYEAQQLAAFDRIFPRLLLGALDVLARLLRHREASVRQRA